MGDRMKVQGDRRTDSIWVLAINKICTEAMKIATNVLKGIYNAINITMLGKDKVNKTQISKTYKYTYINP